MPLIEKSSYQKPFYLFNGHWETIVPSTWRKVKRVDYHRQRLELADGDFLDLDWLLGGHHKLVVISHGLEGSSERHYSKGMALYFHAHGWDTLVWNCRGCSGEMNRLPRFYHHGATEDIQAVIEHAIHSKKYSAIALVGFSMGGSMTLKYLGENGNTLHDSIKTSVVFSVPCHLASSARELDKPSKRFYLNRFLRKLKKKIETKAQQFPNLVSAKGFENIQSFCDFDNRFTAPLHGFKNADDFYERASCWPHIASIEKPTLIVNALNDPFLPKECFPFDIAKKHSSVFLETPHSGGHVGFTLAGKKENWMEVRAFEFIQNYTR